MITISCTSVRVVNVVRSSAIILMSSIAPNSRNVTIEPGQERARERQDEERVDVRADRDHERQRDHRDDRPHRIRSERDQHVARHHGLHERRRDRARRRARAAARPTRARTAGCCGRCASPSRRAAGSRHSAANRGGQQLLGLGMPAEHPAEQVRDHEPADEPGDQDAVVEAERLVRGDDGDRVDDRRREEERHRLGDREAAHHQAARERHVAALADRQEHADQRHHDAAQPRRARQHPARSTPRAATPARRSRARCRARRTASTRRAR